MEYSGGCLCGRIRYSASAAPSAPTHCHCSMCRRVSGSTFVTWVGFPTPALKFVGGEPTYYRSSSSASRGFCPTCGSTLTMRYDADGSYVDVAAGTLDSPNQIQPVRHIWHSAAVSWASPADELPKYPRESPDRSAR